MALAPPTAEELKKLELFREKVYKIYPEKDELLLCWLRARDLDLLKAEQMLRRHLLWKKNNEIEELRIWRSPKVFLPYLHSGYDKQGAPVFLMPIGHWDMRANIENGNIVPSLKFVYQTLENVVGAALAENIYQGVVIIDFEHFEYRQISHRTVIQGILEVLKIFENNYPEALKTAFVINAPVFFNYLYAIIKPLINSRTLSKAQIFGPNREKWQEVLFKSIDPDQIPPYWGGTKEGSDQFCSDSWFMQYLPPNFLKKSSSYSDEYGNEWFTIKVPARDKVVFEYFVKGSGEWSLQWSFRTENHDIGFTVIKEDDNQEEGERVLVEYERVESNLKVFEGSLELRDKGKYSLVFDNSYSRTRGKLLHYSIKFEEDQDIFYDVDAKRDFNENF